MNGQTAELGVRVLPEDAVHVDGRLIELAASNVTFMLHKPAGVLSSVSDDRGRSTVMDLLPDVPGLHPAGRLDLNSEGLLLLTTDGDLTLRLTHPRFQVEKEYRVWCAEGTLSRAALQQLSAGVLLEDGPARAVRVTAELGGCRLVLQDGRKRQVRRMLGAVGFSVVELLRTRIGPLQLGKLPAGQYRQLSAAELMRLKDTGS